MSARILVAGVGNVFFGDDGFGVEVARRLLAEPLPPGVTVEDFGIRGVHLAFELLDPPALLIAVDAVQRGGAPGTLYVIEPDLGAIPGALPDAAAQALPAVLPVTLGDAHGMDLAAVFAHARSLGAALPPIRIIGCEVEDLSAGMSLSPSVAGAVPAAMALARELWAEVCAPGLSVAEVVR